MVNSNQLRVDPDNVAREEEKKERTTWVRWTDDDVGVVASEVMRLL